MGGDLSREVTPEDLQTATALLYPKPQTGVFSLCEQAVKGRKMGFAHYSGPSAVIGI